MLKEQFVVPEDIVIYSVNENIYVEKTKTNDLLCNRSEY